MQFADDYVVEVYELGEAQTFYNDLFNVFGLRRRDVAKFEQHLKTINDKLEQKGGGRRIDLLYPGVLIAEHKSAGKDLDGAKIQAEDYMGLMRPEHVPQYVLVCDFQRFRLTNLDTGDTTSFTLQEFPNNIESMWFLTGRERSAPPANHVLTVRASNMMGRIHRLLCEQGYSRHPDMLITRLAFCMFADSVGIFENHAFLKYLRESRPDNAGMRLTSLFETLDKPVDERQKNLSEELDEFEYIDGGLFEERIETPQFTNEMLDLLLQASEFNWSQVSPAIFGSLFQSVMETGERRESGAHYTEEDSILKVIRPLFLDGLYDEFDQILRDRTAARKRRLETFQNKLAGLKFLDPACGSGNFLIIAYREMRRLELDIMREMYGKRQFIIALMKSKVNVDQFYGIEIIPFSCNIAKVGLWMMDHLMNMELSESFGTIYNRIPLEKSPNIMTGDALRTDWTRLLHQRECSYILGNPPYGGARVMDSQKKQAVMNIAGSGDLDYVSAWFVKAADYIDGTDCVIGFVATNSLTQGQQANLLWPMLFGHGIEIRFAYKSFKWGSEAKNMAQVTVVILGLGHHIGHAKRLFHEDGTEANPAYISPYLFGTDDDALAHQTVQESVTRLNNLPATTMGTQPIDGSNYVFTHAERDRFLKAEPGAERYMRQYIGSDEFLHNKRRWLLDLRDAELSELLDLPLVSERVDAVEAFRQSSSRKQTRKLAADPRLYGHTVIPTLPFLVIPEVSSENREYVPIGYLKPPIVPSNKLRVIEGAKLPLFAILTSRMHMVWLKGVGGRLETRFDYAIHTTYNTFPMPDKPLDGLKPFAQAVLQERAKHDESLHTVYGNLNLVPGLKKAHQRLDREVDKLYRRESFADDMERLEYLLGMYAEMIDAQE